MKHVKKSTWTLIFDRLEVVQLRKFVESAARWIDPDLRDTLARVTFSQPEITLDSFDRCRLRALVQNRIADEAEELRVALWEALA